MLGAARIPRGIQTDFQGFGWRPSADPGASSTSANSWNHSSSLAPAPAARAVQRRSVAPGAAQLSIDPRRAVAWLRAHDRGFLATRRAARAAIVMPAMFAVGDVVIGNPAVATFAAFGS